MNTSISLRLKDSDLLRRSGITPNIKVICRFCTAAILHGRNNENVLH